MESRYIKNSVEDYVLDRDFKDWVLNPTKASNLYWEEWISQNPEQVSNLIKAREILLRLSRIKYVPTNQDINDDWEKLSASLSHGQESSPVIPMGPDSILNKHQTNGEKSSFFSPFLIRIAASIVIFILTVVLFHFLEPSQVDETDHIETIVKSNPRGQKSVIFLPDETKVYLNSQSELTYDSDYNVSERIIRLKGEAFFEVARDTLRPFTVVTEDLSTTALGTSFNVCAYTGRPSEVSLMSGKVRVFARKREDKQTYLIPGELTYYAESGDLIKEKFNLKEHALWRHQILNFNSTPIAEAFNIMERWYDVKFEVKEYPKELECTGRFENEYLSNVLTSLGYTLGFTYKMDGKTVKIDFNTKK